MAQNRRKTDAKQKQSRSKVNAKQTHAETDAKPNQRREPMRLATSAGDVPGNGVVTPFRFFIGFWFVSGVVELITAESPEPAR